MSEAISKIMEQAQVFASTWSLVGRGAFATTMEQAEAERTVLRRMVDAALAAAPAQPDTSAEYAKGYAEGFNDACADTRVGELQRENAELRVAAHETIAGAVFDFLGNRHALRL